MSLTFRGDTDLSATTFCNGLTDTEPQTRTLHEVVELDKTLKHTGLFLLGNTGAGILTIEVDTIVLLSVAHLDMALVGVLHGVGGEVGQHLLDTAYVKHNREGVIGIVLNELHPRFFHALGQGLADVVEYHGKVAGCRLDSERLSHVSRPPGYH